MIPWFSALTSFPVPDEKNVVPQHDAVNAMFHGGNGEFSV